MDTPGIVYPEPWIALPISAGMSLRDYFAAQAIQYTATLAACCADDLMKLQGAPSRAELAAGAAYALADAMMEARKPKGEPNVK